MGWRVEAWVSASLVHTAWANLMGGGLGSEPQLTSYRAHDLNPSGHSVVYFGWPPGPSALEVWGAQARRDPPRERETPRQARPAP